MSRRDGLQTRNIRYLLCCALGEVCIENSSWSSCHPDKTQTTSTATIGNVAVASVASEGVLPMTRWVKGWSPEPICPRLQLPLRQTVEWCRQEDATPRFAGWPFTNWRKEAPIDQRWENSYEWLPVPANRKGMPFTMSFPWNLSQKTPTSCRLARRRLHEWPCPHGFCRPRPGAPLKMKYTFRLRRRHPGTASRYTASPHRGP